MAELDEFLKPRVEMDVLEFFENPAETMWKIPVTNFIPPDGRKKADFYPTPTKEVGEKAQKILDAGFHFTSELLRAVNQMAFYITGPCQHEPDDDPEEEDAAIIIVGPGRDFFTKMDAWILAFEIPEDGIYRKYQARG